MRAARTQAAIILSSLLLAACANQIPIHQPLSGAARDGLAATDVVVPIQQSEIFVFVPQSNGASVAMGGGLLGALVDAGIDSVRTSKAEAAVTPLRNAMVDYSFDNTLQGELKSSLGQVVWLHPGSFGVVRDISNDGLNKQLAASHAAAVLFVVADYRLSNDGGVLLVTLQAALIPNNDQLRALRVAKHDDKTPVALVNALYRNRIVFEAHVNGTGDRDKNIAEWSAGNGSAIRAALSMGVKKLVPLLVDDLQRAEGDVAPAANAPQVAVGAPSEVSDCVLAPSEAQCGINAVVLGQDQDGQVLRFKDGSLKYLKTGNF